MTHPPPTRRVHPIVYLDYRVRAVAALLAAVTLASVFSERGATIATWVALAVWALAWPHVAFLHARHVSDTKKAEITNLVIDGVVGGAWIALVRFSPWPTVMFVLALTLGYLSVGGIKLWLVAMGALVAAALVCGAATGFAVDATTSGHTVTLTAVCLLTYAVVFGLVTNRQ